MPTSGPVPSEDGRFTADELRQAIRLLDPNWTAPPNWYADVASAPVDMPYLLPIRVGVALTVVSERLHAMVDLAGMDLDTSRIYLRERELLERVARGEAPPPGWV